MENDKNSYLKGVIFNAYPDSIGQNLSNGLDLLKKSNLSNTFTYFYILPTIFNSDLDRGFSIIDYEINQELVNEKDLIELKEIDITLKLDIVLNHLSVNAYQFQDLLKNGDKSEYKDFFIDWNNFWEGKGKKNSQGLLIPFDQYLDKLFLRKPGLPILEVMFPDNSYRYYWNTFYQKVHYQELEIDDLRLIGIIGNDAKEICEIVNNNLSNNSNIDELDLGIYPHLREQITILLNKKKEYLGQMDLNVNSPNVWKFYEDTITKLQSYGCGILRLDAFAYLDKQVGMSNFFNEPQTWNHLERLKFVADKNQMIILPEIHSPYGSGLHKKLGQKGYHFYDFFFPGLIIYSIEFNDVKPLTSWGKEIIRNNYKTINMMGCHDGIPVLDLKGTFDDGNFKNTLLDDDKIDSVIDIILKRGGLIKNIFDSQGKKISYYQVNATFFSTLGESVKKFLLARAVQLFFPGTPQVWYLDLFAGSNDYKAIKGSNHKEINRTTISMDDINSKLTCDIVKVQLDLIRLRNTSEAFLGKPTINSNSEDDLEIIWRYNNHFAKITACFKTFDYNIEYL